MVFISASRYLLMKWILVSKVNIKISRGWPTNRVEMVFLLDDICAEGYTYSWYFINQLSPRKWMGYGLPPLHGQVMSLFEPLPEKKQVIIFVEWIIYLTRHSL